jgi:hypothetical protein
MQSLRTRYRGFRLIASAGPRRDGLHTASIRIERQGGQARTFHDLDFFYDNVEAVKYATLWGRIWIEANVRFPT